MMNGCGYLCMNIMFIAFFCLYMFFNICINFLFRLLVDIDFRLVHFITDFRLVDRFSAFYVCCILG